MFGERLNKTRKEQGFSAQQMADAIEINRRSYFKYEDGSRHPSFAILIKIADKLNVSVDYLLERDDFLRSQKKK